MENLCRVCLTQSKTLTHLSAPISEYSTESSVLSARKVLERVTFSSIEFNNQKYPQSICQMCLSMLKFAYEFQLQFNKSQKVLSITSKKQEKPVRQKNKLTLKKLLTRTVKDVFDNVVIIEEDCIENITPEVTTENCQKTDVIVGNSEAIVDSGLNDIEKILIKSENRTVNEALYVEQLNIANRNEIVTVTPDVIFEKTDSNCSLNDAILEGNGEGIGGNNETVVDVSESNVETFPGVNDNSEMSEMVIIEELDMNDYYQSTDDPSKTVDFPELHGCNICSAVYESRTKLNRHVRRHGTYKVRITQLCSECGFLAKSQSAARYHKFKHTGKEYRCQLCKKTYNTLYGLNMHRKFLHNSNRNYLCSDCGKTFKYSNALQYHMRLHTGEKRYVCNYCGLKFRMCSGLKRHIRIHTKDKPYNCEFCEKSFASKGEVVSHEMTHTGLRPYNCEYCGKGFTKIYNRKLHYLSHSGPHECCVCSKTFIELKFLNIHLKVAHNISLQVEDVET